MTSIASADRPLTIAFAISLAFHTILLGVQLIRLQGQPLRLEDPRMEIVYESRPAQSLPPPQSKLVEFQQHPESLPGPADVKTPMTQIRIPDRPALTVSNLAAGSAEENTATRSAVVDLTNLVEAAQGDPVLLSYFSAIREQIQRTANHGTWSTGQPAQGVVYISFLLTSTGQVLSTNIVADRSVSSNALQDIALRIVKASSPFAAFPPSMPEHSKTVVVPLEFMTGS